MIVRALIVFFGLTLLLSCSSNQEQRLSQLDKVYGYCDNPHRGISGRDYKICKDKERAAGPDGEINDPIGIDSLLSKFDGNKQSSVVSVSDTNNYLWDGALQVLNEYSFKITDFDGGYIETDWIMKSNLPNQRCLIKSHITSMELISTGVSVKIICEELVGNTWYSADQSFEEEEKQLTLQILKQANTLSTNS
jgi:uncharacterized lipoprotein